MARPLVLGQEVFTIESDWVGSGRVGSGRVGSGRVGSGRVGSGRMGSDQWVLQFSRFGSGQEATDRVR